MKELLLENWDEIMEFLRTQYGINPVSYTTWLKNLKFKDYVDDVIIISNDNDDENGLNSNSFILKRYSNEIKTSIAEVLNLTQQPEIRIVSESVKKPASSPEEVKPMPLNYSSDIILNPAYTFDNFIVSRSNKMVHVAALTVAEAPGQIYNPLYIYGDPGLGKTHLMHSIAHFILENSPELKVMFVTSDKFVNELIENIKNNRDTAKFREKYRNVDILLVDDIQFIIGKQSTQEEFFNTFNYLRDSKKQIVISSDKPPRDFNNLEERFRSRFESGLIVDITAPDFEAKMAILKKKIELMQREGAKIDINDECLSYIADINANIRTIEGALTKVLAYSNINHIPIDIDLVKYALRDITSPESKKVITPEFIINVVGEHFDISVNEIMSTRKDKNTAIARQIAMFLCNKYTNSTSTHLAKVFGRDHSTVLYGIETIKKKIENDSDISSKVDIIIKKLNIEE